MTSSLEPPAHPLDVVARFESHEDATFAWSVLHRHRIRAELQGPEGAEPHADGASVGLLVPSGDRERALKVLTAMSDDAPAPLEALDRWRSSPCPRCGASEYLITGETRAIALFDLVAGTDVSSYVRVRRQCRACRYTS